MAKTSKTRKSATGRGKSSKAGASSRGASRTSSKAPVAARAKARVQAGTPALRTNRISTYSIHPGVAMVQGWIETLKEKTGRTLDEWIKHIRSAGPDDEKARRTWLKERYGLGTNTAWWLAERSREVGMGMVEEDPDTYLQGAVENVEQMYGPGKEALRPLHDELIRTAQAIGPEIRFCPCKTIVPIYRKNVIAQIKPSTRTRIDFGLSLGDTKASGRLIDTGGFAKKDRITHRIEVSSFGDIDDELKGWLRIAYERNVK